MGKKKSKKKKIKEKKQPEEKHLIEKKGKPVKFKLIALLLIVLTGVFVYANSLDCVFQFDDETSIIDESRIKGLDEFCKAPTWLDVNFRPLTMFTFAMNYKFHGLSVTGFHVVNLFIHIITGWFIFLLSLQILSSTTLNNESIEEHKMPLALFIALIFMAHPIQTQAITYIVQRMTSLAAMFYIIAIYAYIKARRVHVTFNAIDSRTIIIYTAALLSGVLSLLSKQISITLPAAVLLVELLFIRDNNNKPHKKFITVSASIMTLAIFIVVASGNLPSETESISRGEYFVTQLKVIVKYIQLMILPIQQNIDHDISVSRTLMGWKEIGSLLILLGIFISGIRLFTKNKLLSFGIMWFFITISVESSIIPIRDVVFEHRLYLPMFGYSICLVTLVFMAFPSRQRFYMYLFLSFITILLGTAAINRNGVWKTKYTLWSDSARKSPDKARPLNNIGLEMLNAGRLDEAIAFLNKSLEKATDNSPEIVVAKYNIGIAWYKKGRLDTAIDFYEKALKIEPEQIKILNNYGIALGDKGELEKAIKIFRKALRVNPNRIDIIKNLGLTFGRRGMYDKEIEQYQRALRIMPGYFDALYNLGVALLKKGDANTGIEFFKRALQVRQNHPETFFNLGNAFVRKGDRNTAIAFYKKVLMIIPNHQGALRNLKFISAK